MPIIRVYHTPNFLDYRGDHRQLVPPTRPVAMVTTPANLPPALALDFAFAHTQHRDRPWYERPQVTPQLRSTSVGDILELVDPEAPADSGTLYVVETTGFHPFQPPAIQPVHRLAAAHRTLAAALDTAPAGLMAAARTALAAMADSLDASGYPASESPILWQKAQVGDLVGKPETGVFCVIARRLRPKWRARQVAAHLADAQIWIDGARSWAVLIPAGGENGAGREDDAGREIDAGRAGGEK